MIGISEHQTHYVHGVARRLEDAGIRVEMDVRNQKVGYKIREAETKKIPFMAIAGAREMEAGNVSVRRHGVGDQGNMPVESLIGAIEEEIARTVRTSRTVQAAE